MGRGPLIRSGELTLRPLRYRDRDLWNQVRRVNRDWLNPWEATRPDVDGDGPLPSYNGMIHFQNQELKAGRSYSMAMWISDEGRERFIGQVTLGGIVMGAYRGGYIGYWIDQRYAGRGYTTRAVVALTDYAFQFLNFTVLKLTYVLKIPLRKK